MSILEQIKALQFEQKAEAEALALEFIRDTLRLDAVSVELRPLAVSLNSFNGFMTLADGKRLFFKTHTEPDNVIGEYYHAGELARAGYPVLQPIYSSTEAGRQLLVYEVIEDPSVFDTAWEIEMGNGAQLAALTQAQNDADDLLCRIYEATIEEQSAEAAAKAPIHQLFYHRLIGGRLERFYGAPERGGGENVTITLPSGTYSMAQVRQARWVINGQEYDATLDDLITEAIRLLQPAQPGASIIGHGDAHNGNVFFQRRGANASLMYFDPAFAGRHHPLLDLTKPLFHNVFAMWMYFPQAKRDATRIKVNVQDEVWRVEHDYALHPVREMFLRSKVERTLIPVLQMLKARNWLRADWRTDLKAALFCCPLLTMNLTDGEKFPPEIGLLGLAMAVEMGGESRGSRSRIDTVLDEVEQALN
jgi:phosphotransferase family enzyme